MTMQKTVLITGASSGFGLEACDAFLAEGYSVLAAVRGGATRMPLFADLFARYSGNIELFELDLLDPASIDRLVTTLESRAPIDGLINNAGYGLFGATEDVSDESLRLQMEVNFFGTFALTQKLLPSLRKTKGVILTVSSIVGRHALPLTGAYCASKFAVEGWMESLSAELKPYDVACYILEPGGYPTGFGTSLSWSEPHLQSAYAAPTKGYQILRENISKQNQGKSIRPVAQKMVYLLSKRPSGLRHLIGSDALMTALFGKILPANLWHNIISLVMNKLQRKNV
ncbi:MAG: SDR family oxidoreductase [Proteobacteria bacterium]|nr:MAG: SDR family oxidoreductase [Pseudomonadota bacterium]